MPSPYALYDHVLNDFHKQQKKDLKVTIEEGKKMWHDRIEKRVSEISELITECVNPYYLQKMFNTSNEILVDTDKLIVSGHSMGGATAIKAGDSDSRIKAVLTHDPWMSILEPDYETFDALLDKPLTILMSGWLRDKFATDNEVCKKLSPSMRNKSQL